MLRYTVLHWYTINELGFFYVLYIEISVAVELGLFKPHFVIDLVADFACEFGQIFCVRCLSAGLQLSHMIYLIYVSSNIDS